MSKIFVADCSIAIGWVRPTQATPLTEKLLAEAYGGAEIHVPSIWHLEVANALLAAVRRKLLVETHRQASIALLSRISVFVDPETSGAAFSSISDLAIKYTLSVYDAAYLELAQRKSLPLGSRDEALRVAAKKLGLQLL